MWRIQPSGGQTFDGLTWRLHHLCLSNYIFSYKYSRHLYKCRQSSRFCYWAEFSTAKVSSFSSWVLVSDWHTRIVWHPTETSYLQIHRAQQEGARRDFTVKQFFTKIWTLTLCISCLMHICVFTIKNDGDIFWAK